MFEESQDGAVLLSLFLGRGFCGRRLLKLGVHLIVGRGRRRQGGIRVGHGCGGLRWMLLVVVVVAADAAAG